MKYLKVIPSPLFKKKLAFLSFGKTQLPIIPSVPATFLALGDGKKESVPVGEPIGKWKKTLSPENPMKREEEHQRFLEYNYAKMMANAKTKRDVNPPSALWAIQPSWDLVDWLGRSRHLEEYIARRNMALLYSTVLTYYQKFNLNWDDAVSEAQLCFLRAINSFNTSRQLKFSTYAVTAIKHGLERIAVHRQNLRTSITKHMKQENLATMELRGLEALEESNEDMITTITDALRTNSARLTAVERLIIVQRFGIGGGGGKTLKQLSVIHKMTPEAIRQNQNRALKKLRGILD